MPPRGRSKKGRRQSPSSCEDSADELLQENNDVRVKLQKGEEQEEDSDIDDPHFKISAKNVKPLERVGQQVNPDKALHMCLMNKISELSGHSASSRCTTKTALNVPYRDIKSHYFLHYRARGLWDDLLPPTNKENNRIESYQCKICDQKFRIKANDDPESARASFIYHYAVFHGKIIKAMQEDVKVDMQDVLEILYRFDSAAKKFIQDPKAEEEFEDSPCIISETCDWKIKHCQQLGGGEGSAALVVNTSQQEKTLALQQAYQRSFCRIFYKCPKNNKKDCKDYEKNKDVNSLKLHLFNHYLDYWKDLVPVYKEGIKETKCDECTPAKRVCAETSDALRQSMICHRAIVHEELRMAIEEDIEEFDQDLFNRLFNPAAVKPPQVIFSGGLQGNTKDQKAVNQSAYRPTKPVATKAKASKPAAVPKAKARGAAGSKASKRPSSRKKKDETSSDEEDVVIPKLPYVRKRIKQNLKDIDLEDDSDKDEAWERSQKKAHHLAAKPPPRSLPGRQKRKMTFFQEDEDEDLE